MCIWVSGGGIREMVRLLGTAGTPLTRTFTQYLKVCQNSFDHFIFHLLLLVVAEDAATVFETNNGNWNSQPPICFLPPYPVNKRRGRAACVAPGRLRKKRSRWEAGSRHILRGRRTDGNQRNLGWDVLERDRFFNCLIGFSLCFGTATKHDDVVGDNLCA